MIYNLKRNNNRKKEKNMETNPLNSSRVNPAEKTVFANLRKKYPFQALNEGKDLESEKRAEQEIQSELARKKKEENKGPKIDVKA